MQCGGPVGFSRPQRTKLHVVCRPCRQISFSSAAQQMSGVVRYKYCAVMVAHSGPSLRDEARIHPLELVDFGLAVAGILCTETTDSEGPRSGVELQ